MTDIAICGEAWGENEERERTPFVGAAGYHLDKMLAEAGIRRADCFLTNVFNLRPKGNRIETLCGAKEWGIQGFPALSAGKYVRSEYESELIRLQDELCDIVPNITVALGNTAMWALLGKTAISKLRGTTFRATHICPGLKVLPTYHPSFVMRGNEGWQNRPIVIMDLMKAKRESAFPEVRYPKRTIYIPETIGDLYEYRTAWIEGSRRLAVDIETSGQQITCIGLAPRESSGIVIPFYASGYPGRSYWKSTEDEYLAWVFVKDLLESNGIQKTFQNGLYDIAFLLRAYGIRVMGAEHDTMLLHHALQPESLKGLGFLGSLYTDERAWKTMRKVETLKRDD